MNSAGNSRAGLDGSSGDVGRSDEGTLLDGGRGHTTSQLATKGLGKASGSHREECELSGDHEKEAWSKVTIGIIVLYKIQLGSRESDFFLHFFFLTFNRVLVSVATAKC